MAFPANLHPEAIMAAGYAALLIVVAVGLQHLAKRSHQHSQRFDVVGFQYHPHHDLWECPTGEYLRPREVDHVRRLVRYRAKAEACNGCRIKIHCTDSDEGREVTRALDPWLQSEIGQFHRGIALTLVLLAALIASGALVRHHGEAELAVLGAVLVSTAIMAVRTLRAFTDRPRHRYGE